jgi:hypothetical protein
MFIKLLLLQSRIAKRRIKGSMLPCQTKTTIQNGSAVGNLIYLSLLNQYCISGRTLSISNITADFSPLAGRTYLNYLFMKYVLLTESSRKILNSWKRCPTRCCS